MAKKVIARMCPASQQDIEPTWGYNGTQSNTNNTALHDYWGSFTHCPFTNMTIGGVDPIVGDGFYVTANTGYTNDPNLGANSFAGIPFSLLDTYIPTPNPGPAGWVYPGTGYVGTPPYTTQPAVGYDANGMPSNPQYPIWDFRIKFEVVAVEPNSLGIYIDFERDNNTCGTYEYSWDCIPVGDHPKFGSKCTKISGLYGQFDSKIDCLRSGCEGLLGPKTINSFNMNFTDLPTSGGSKKISINGTNGASFYLEVKNEDGYYYNFITKTFAAVYNKLDGIVVNGEYETTVKFPAVTDNDQYDIFLYTKDGTSHTDRQSTFFRDGSIDLNSSSGSNGALLQKVLYQTLDVTLTLSMYSSGGLIPALTVVNDEIEVGRYNSNQSQSFTATATRSSNALTIDKQPILSDVLTFLEPVVGSAPIQIPGENIYPAVTGTDTVNGARNTDAVAVTMDSAVATKMAVGDRVTGNAALNAGNFTVASLDSTNVFSLSSVVAIADGVALSFSNQMNYRWPLVNAVSLQEGMIVVADGVNVASGVEISKYEEKITLFENTEKEEELILKEVVALDRSKDTPTVVRGLETVAPADVVFNQQMPLALAGDTLKVGGYGIEEIKRISGWDVSFNSLKVELNTITTTKSSGSGTSVVVASAVGIADETTQTVDGATTSSNKVVLDSVDGLFVGQTIYAVSAGTLTGNPTIVSINELTKAINLSSVQTFADNITLTFANSVVSGPGIAAGSIDPFVTNISGTTLTLSATQTLEDGQTFTFENTGNVATLTGNVTIRKAGSKDLVLRFDVDKFLTYHS